MKRLLLLLLFALAAVVALAADLAAKGGATVMSAQQRYAWSGSCSVMCHGGECRVVCGSGILIANGKFEAELQAEAALRLQAQGQGTPIEGSFRVSVRASFLEGSSAPTLAGAAANVDAGKAAQLRRYDWTALAYLRKAGKEITINVSGSVFAENGDLATAAAGRAVEAHPDVRRLVSQGFEYRGARCQCRGPF